jgi:hypothetical protein
MKQETTDVRGICHPAAAGHIDWAVAGVRQGGRRLIARLGRTTAYNAMFYMSFLLLVGSDVTSYGRGQWPEKGTESVVWVLSPVLLDDVGRQFLYPAITPDGWSVRPWSQWNWDRARRVHCHCGTSVIWILRINADRAYPHRGIDERVASAGIAGGRGCGGLGRVFYIGHVVYSK